MRNLIIYTDQELLKMVDNMVATMKGGKAEFARRSGIKEQSIKDWYRRGYKIGYQDGMRIIKMAHPVDMVIKTLLRTAMDIIPYLTPLKCPNCHVALVRIPESIATDTIACLECGAGGSYKEVIEYKGGIKNSIFTEKELSHIRENFGFPD